MNKLAGRIFILGCAINLASAFGIASNAHAQANFFQGKTIRVIRGGQPGDLYDLWTRHIATYLGKHIPGNPSVMVQNMPGAGSVIAANNVYNLAKPDGLTIGSLNPGIYMDQLVGRKEVQFNWAKFGWLGTPEQTESVVFFRGDSPYKTIEDVRKASEPPKCGSGGAAGTGYFFPKLLEDTVGAKFNIVLGYQGGGPIDLAVEKGEIHCRAMTIESFMAREPFHTWRKTNFVRSLAQSGRKRDARLSDTPTIYELMDQYKASEQSRRVATVILAGGVFGRPLVGPAGIPPDVVKNLRNGMASALKDAELKVEAEKRSYELDPVSGEEMQRLAKEVMSQPPAVLERMKKVLGE